MKNPVKILFVKMWNKKLLRTKRTTYAEAFILCVVTLTVIVQNVVLAYSVTEQPKPELNNEFESATAMISFRNAFERIIDVAGDASLPLTPLLQVGNTAAIRQRLEQQVKGLQFHAVHHALLCDEHLAEQSRLNVRIVSPQEAAVPLTSGSGVSSSSVKYVCAMWPVINVMDEIEAGRNLEWLSKNGIERRSREEDGIVKQYLVMHLGERTGEMKR